MGCSMKNAVYVHKDYRLPELKRMFKNAVIAFDTNAILGLYNYSSDVLEDIFGLLTHPDVKDRLFVPYQTAEEFYKNREKVIQKAKKLYTTKLGAITSAINALHQDINKSHFLGDWIKTAQSTLQSSVEALRNTYDANPVDFDAVSEMIENIFDDACVGPELLDKEMYESMFENRVKYNTPPGITDVNKQNNKSGDFIIWSELMAKAKSDAVDIIFITNEKKYDWWEKSIKIRPNNKLLIEFNKKTGQRCFFFHMDAFINLLARELGYKMKDNIRMPLEYNEYDTVFAEEPVVADSTVAEEKCNDDQAG